jgi:serine/threonine-protein kinase RsbW
VVDADVTAVLLALTEACSNVLIHAYEGRVPAPLDVDLEVEPDTIGVLLRDQGRAFQPPSTAAPDPDALAEGGYGLFLIQSLMDEVSYTPVTPTGTALRMTKRRTKTGG